MVEMPFNISLTFHFYKNVFIDIVCSYTYSNGIHAKLQDDLWSKIPLPCKADSEKIARFVSGSVFGLLAAGILLIKIEIVRIGITFVISVIGSFFNEITVGIVFVDDFCGISRGILFFIVNDAVPQAA